MDSASIRVMTQKLGDVDVYIATPDSSSKRLDLPQGGYHKLAGLIGLERQKSYVDLGKIGRRHG